MKRQGYAAAFMCMYLAASCGFGSEHSAALDVLPKPLKVIQKKGKFRLTDSFRVGMKETGTQRVYRGVDRLLRRLSGRTGLFFQPHRVRAEKEAEDADLQIRFKRTGKLEPGEDESYVLRIKPGTIRLKARTDIGILRGLETVLQLLSVDDEGYYLPAVTVKDEPRFPWRGLLIDAARHFLPLAVIKRNLDGMAAVKMNVLHWHLTDDQGFRLECRTFPRLHQLGSDGDYYTREQVRQVIAYAGERGIRVVPEFDIPGHSTSWLVGYPELASAPGPYRVERKWGIFDPTFNPTIEETYQFFDRFFAEMAALFPDPYVHIGGDENNGKQWDTNPGIQAFKKRNNIADNHGLQAYFNRRIQEILAKYGKKMMGWDEILQPQLPRNVMIQSWRGREFLRQAAQKGYPAVLSNGYYIDLCQPADFHYLNDPVPPDSRLTKKQRRLIYGGEATMWAELVSPETVDSRIWPRTAAIAERLWSPGSVRDTADMYRRLEVVNLHLEELGLMHIKNPEMMLRRLAGGADISALKVLVEVVEPVKKYRRHQLGKTYTSRSPLTRLVDAAVPDAPVARKFRQQVERFLQGRGENKDIANELKKYFSLWQANHRRLKEIICRSPILGEIEDLSRDLSRLGETGLGALEQMTTQKDIDMAWLEESSRFLKQASKPRAEVEVMIIPALESMLAYLQRKGKSQISQ